MIELKSLENLKQYYENCVLHYMILFNIYADGQQNQLVKFSVYNSLCEERWRESKHRKL